MSNKKILVIGSLNMDMVVTMSHLPKPGETLLGDNISYVPGGKGANQAYAGQKLGGTVKMLGKVGDDTFGPQLIHNLQAIGVDVSSIEVAKNTSTGLAVIYVDEDAQNEIVVIPGANQTCDKDYISKHVDSIKEADAIVLQMEIPHDAVYHAITLAKQHGKLVVLNPAPAPNRPLPDAILASIDYITPNETELEILTGIKVESLDNIEKAANILLQKGVKKVLVTCGDKGAMLVDSNGDTHFPGLKVKAVDTTAAGDCFNAAVVVALMEGNTEERAIIFANKASAIAVTRKGAQPSVPAREEVK